MKLYITFCLLLQLYSCQCKQPKVTTENGVVVGTYQTSHSGVQYQAFLGIPYAKPPVGEYRFKESQRLDDNWVGEFNATIPPPVCLQLDHFTRRYNDDGSWGHEVVGDEDCLFVNVFTKDTDKINKDVIVYIHCGAFMFGSGYFYSPHYLMDHDDVVYVSLNYRLGPLGFLTTGDSVTPGNNGLKDQVLALQWVQRNIASFRGDPKKVTITGLSAGGASVHYHYLSPMSNGLFNRGWSFSGNALTPWALVTNGVERTHKLAEFMGCQTIESRLLVECLRRRPARQIVRRTENFQKYFYNPYTVFGPVVEVDSPRPFIDKKPIDILRAGEAKDLPWIHTVVSAEGLYPAAEFAWSSKFLDELDIRWSELSSSMLFYDDTVSNNKDIADKVKNLYLKQHNNRISAESRHELIQMLGDRLFVDPAVRGAKLMASTNTQHVYVYYFDYRGKSTFANFMTTSDVDLGVCHGDDLMYVLSLPGADAKSTPDDANMSKLLLDIYVHFAKTGKVPKKLNWEPVSKNVNDDLKYLKITSPTDYKMVQDSTLGRVTDWEQLFPELVLTEHDEL